MTALLSIYDGWDGYQTSLVHALTPLSPEQLAWRPREGMRSVGETAGHVALGRLDWFNKIGAPGAAEPAGQARSDETVIAGSPVALVRWLEAPWQMVENALREWTIADLPLIYEYAYQGKTYAITPQWTIWRILFA